MSATRELRYPNWKTVGLDDESITVRFWTPGSKFGPVVITLARSDFATMLLHADPALSSEDATRPTPNSCPGLNADGMCPFGFGRICCATRPTGDKE